MNHYIEDAMQVGDKDEFQTGWKEYHMNVLDTIKATGSYNPPRPLHPIRRFLCCQRHSKDYIYFANMKANSYYIRPEIYKEVCSAYIAAFDECASGMPSKAVHIRKHLIKLLTMYARSCTSLKHLEPQRSIVQAM